MTSLGIRAALSAGFLVVSASGLCSCSPDVPQTDSKSNWLEVCSTTADCDDDLACLCGVCSITCVRDAECGEGRPASCLDPEAYANCPDSSGSSGAESSCRATCDTADDCDEAQICVRNVCMTEGEPEADACSSTLDWSDADTLFEVAILNRVNEQRAAGTECGNASFQAQTPFVLDFRLRCAARLHSAEMNELDYFNETSPDGTTPDERISAAGYAYSNWGIVISQGNQQASIDATFSSYCPWFSDPGYSDLGVGAEQSLWSLYFAAQ